ISGLNFVPAWGERWRFRRPVGEVAQGRQGRGRPMAPRWQRPMAPRWERPRAADGPTRRGGDNGLAGCGRIRCVQRETPPFAARPVLAAVLVQVVLLSAASQGYGYHRDELYFRMLHPSWGYFDEPPLTPLLAHVFRALADQPWALRIPATLAT